ncbi:chromosome segregation ATPase [Enterovibrio norvegicus]|uniref:Chromosome segregation ATPase n=1 Tax=Enterovibrio norvegicus TaxID=188144 RepID=A0A2N7L5D5_9GAMM|nr:chromosome segregation ATPase [Enterovibrio norvegicus]PML80939.1 chromosome segregation ATPase [Enterovibrio norvegicus]PMN67469.1 chromosome segregation ATPase [Enterovibrio norvegicus]PMN88834.1 chromosome segregation ATPase [Enterovibrio norvegicus]
MVSIQGLPQPIQRPSTTRRKKSDNASPSENTAKPSIVATAVSLGIRNPEMAQEAHQQIHYDLPDGKSRHALASYMDIKNQARREELAALFGVDIFV